MADILNLETLSIAEARGAVCEGRVSAAVLAEKHYERIATHDPEINSYLALSRERALAQAEKIDSAVKSGGELGPLAGVPIGIKDVLVMRGAPATAGSLILKGYHPPYDATVVAKLEAAGAVLLGKLNCDEFAMGSSNENSAYGPVRNPRAGRLVGWFRGIGCGGILCGVTGHGHRRLDSSAGGVLRRGRRAADVWPRVALRADCVCVVTRSRGAIDSFGRRCGDDAGCTCGER